MTGAQPVAVRLQGPTGPMLAWWHAAPQPGPLAVVLCGPWGDEDLGAHRGLRDLAQRLAGSGWSALRFDGPGQGDSFEDPPAGNVDLWPVWQRGLDAAIDQARALSGCARVVLLGVRLGCLQVAEAAARRVDVAGLALLLPPASGRAWLREVTMLGAGLAHRTPETDQADSPDDAGAWLGGFHLPAATLEGVRSAKWPAAPATTVASVLCLDRASQPLAAAVRRQVASMAADLQHESRNDLERLVAIAHDAHWPPDLGLRLTRWLADMPAPPDGCPQTCASDGTPAAVQAVAWTDVEAEGVRESMVRIPETVGCLGVLSRAALAPAAGQIGKPPNGLLLLSSGEERRIGPHRLWVPLARERARRGDVVLRLDLPGVGDSPSREPGLADDVYDARVSQDVAAAAQWLRQAHGVGQVIVLGLCSGGYHAWRAAVLATAVDAVVPINPLVFHWRTGMSLNPMDHHFGRIAVVARLGPALRVGGNWGRLLRGQVNTRFIVAALGRRLLMASQDALRSAARCLRWPLGDDLATELRSVLQRSIDVHFVFAENEPGHVLLVKQGGRALTRCLKEGSVRVTSVAGADHTFAGARGRSRLYQYLHDWLDARQSIGASKTCT